MLWLLLILVAAAAIAGGMAWLAERPGTLVINWQGYEFETSITVAVVSLMVMIGVAIIVWSLAVQLWRSPASVGAFFNRRRNTRGMEALSSGMIAIGAGDRSSATRYAMQARKALPDEPLTHLLRAQAAQLSGDRTTSRRIFESMLTHQETEQLGLRGLYLEAEREGETEAARQFAERAVALNPKLGWPVDALFDLQCKEGDWESALATLAISRRHRHHEKSVLDRRRAVLLTARAQALEDTNPDQAMGLALEAHGLAHKLIPAAAIAGRLLAARGNTRKAARVLERTWRLAPHPDLATAYAYARLGDSPRDRLDRVKRLAQLHQHSIETPIALARAAIEAHDYDTARHALEPLSDERKSQRVCMLMARVEGEEHGDTGRVREWLARALHAPRDPAWTADGVVSDHWAPISPVTGTLDAFQWRVPIEAVETADTTAALAKQLEDLVKLGAPAPSALPGEPSIVRQQQAIDVTTAAAPAQQPSEGSPATTQTVPTEATPPSPAPARPAPSSAIDVKPAPSPSADAADQPSPRQPDRPTPAAPKAPAPAPTTTAATSIASAGQAEPASTAAPVADQASQPVSTPKPPAEPTPAPTKAARPPASAAAGSTPGAKTATPAPPPADRQPTSTPKRADGGGCEPEPKRSAAGPSAASSKSPPINSGTSRPTTLEAKGRVANATPAPAQREADDAAIPAQPPDKPMQSAGSAAGPKRQPVREPTR